MPTVSQIVPSRAAAVPNALNKAPDELRLLRWGVLFYIALWVFEGALRKWIVPSLANPLLVVRDPVLIGLYALAMAKGVFPRSAFIPIIVGLGLVATFVSLVATDAPMLVTMYGLRADFLHLPLIFLLPNVLHRADLRLIGKGWLVVSAGMAVLVLLQFRSGPGAFLNRGAGEGTVMLESAFGKIRPSGTFSYTNGLAGFTAVTAAFFLQHLLEKRLFPRLVWLGSIPALMILVLLSGSRGAVGIMALILGAVGVICLFQTRYVTASLKMGAILAVCASLVGSFAVFQSGLSVFSKRFESNNVEQHGIAGRYIDGYLLPFYVLHLAEPAGVGLGMGTNVAVGLAHTGQRKFAFSEGEGGRVILENGPAVGFAYLLLRLAITVYLGAQALRALRREGATLPLMLFSACFNEVLMGQFSQPTELGYATITAGLCLTASLRAGEPAPGMEGDGESAVEPEEIEAKPVVKRGVTARVVTPVALVVPAGPARRGRSAYAAQLHGGEKAADEPPTGGTE